MVELSSKKVENTAGSARHAFRADIEGLRAVAVGLVLLWHAGVTILPGGFIGVDVFFVISGFLMTGILHRELERTGTISCSKFYARRARRLIPASTVVLACTAVATWLVLPPTRWWTTGQEIAAAGTYVVNWLLASGTVNYLAQDAAPSAVQHFWSLSVEEQFYLVWPLLVVAVGLIAAKIRWSVTRSVLCVLGIAFIVSLAFSVVRTPSEPGPSYFVSTTRIWELALGGLVAVTMPTWSKLPTAAAAALAWTGVAVVFVVAFTLSDSLPFPGWVALLPTAATAAVLACGPAAGARGPVLVLRNRPSQVVGKLSYSLYLWHWPILVIGGYLVTGGTTDLSVVSGLVLVAVSFLPAALSYYYVETPFRERGGLANTTKRALSLGAVGIVVAVVAGVGVSAAGLIAERSASAPLYTSTSSPVDFGAQRIGTPGFDQLTPGSPVSPDPIAAADDNPPIYARGCQQGFSSSKPVACEFGNPDAPTTVALIGDSHAAHWVDALEYVAQQRNWRLVTYTKSSCALIDATVINRSVPAPKCTEWNNNVLAEIEKAKPSAVVVSNIDYQIVGATDEHAAMVDAMASAWKSVVDMGVPVFVLRDTPASGVDPADCLAGHRDDPSRCATARETAFGTRGLAQLDAARQTPVTMVDLTDKVCPGEPCSPVIGGVMVYRDRTHMTATYSRSLGPSLDSRLPPLGTG